MLYFNVIPRHMPEGYDRSHKNFHSSLLCFEHKILIFTLWLCNWKQNSDWLEILIRRVTSVITCLYYLVYEI